jgi:hypothetical protein
VSDGEGHPKVIAHRWLSGAFPQRHINTWTPEIRKFGLGLVINTLGKYIPA